MAHCLKTIYLPPRQVIRAKLTFVQDKQLNGRNPFGRT